MNLESILKKHYKIIETIEESTSGTVIRAQAAEGGRELILKIMKTDRVDDPEELTRIRRELKALSNLHHKNIVSFYNVGLTEDGTPYGVMEHFHGETLKDVLKAEKHLNAEKANSIMQQICEGLTHVHKKGILHRDLKPESIILSETDGASQVKIADFNFAKLTRKSMATTQSMTKTGLIVGDPNYISPEQITGMQIDQRSDVYACGCILYEMLTGHKPFYARNTVELIHMHCTQEAVPFAEHGIVSEGPQLEWICKKAMEKAPEHRYQNMEDMQSDLKLAQLGSNNLLANPARNPAKKQLLLNPKNSLPAHNRSRLLKLASLILGLVFLAYIGPELIPEELLVRRPGSDWPAPKIESAKTNVTSWLDRAEHESSRRIGALVMEQSNPNSGTWKVFVSKKGLLRYNSKMHCGVLVSSSEKNLVFFNDKTKVYYASTVEKWLAPYESMLQASIKERREIEKQSRGYWHCQYDVSVFDLSNSVLSRVPIAAKPLSELAELETRTEANLYAPYKVHKYINVDQLTESDDDQFVVFMIEDQNNYPIFKTLYGKNFPNGTPVQLWRINRGSSHTMQFETKKINKELVPESLFSYPKDYSRVGSEQAVINDENGRKLERAIIESHPEIDENVESLMDKTSPPSPFSGHAGED